LSQSKDNLLLERLEKIKNKNKNKNKNKDKKQTRA